MDLRDTIYGEMTFPGKSALRVVRLSGDLAIKCVSKLFIPYSAPIRNPKMTVRGKLVDINGRIIDDIICIFFKKPNSYTGEDVVEFHCHGNEGIIKILSSSLETLGVRKAKNGEFSFRAFINGRLSIKDARRLKKIMEAQTAVESSAVFESQDIIERELGLLKEEIIKLLSLWEARIDFPEEVPPKETKKWKDELLPLQKKCGKLLDISHRSKQVREGFRVAIFGAPNSGKSSLFNNLLGRERAIVTPHPGTTRDILEEKLEIEGIPVVFLDTAGVRRFSKNIEHIGIERALKAANTADIVLFLFDGKKGWKKSDEEFLTLLSTKQIIKVATKKDLYKNQSFPKNVIQISNKSGFGIERLIRKVASSLRSLLPKDNFMVLEKEEIALIQRISSLLKEAFASIKREDEVSASDFLKRALYEIDSLYKTDSFENIYDTIFKEFCIGK